MKILEACVETLDQCLNAKQKGAHQFELCSRLDLDGLTPDIELTQKVISHTGLPTKVMIRNRGGDFCYSEADIKVMLDSITAFKKLSIGGFVFGSLLLSEDNQWVIDISTTKRICEAAYPIEATFHKAIDLCKDPISEAIKLLEIDNLEYILTSGGHATAHDGAKIIEKMQKSVQPHISIIAAGKVTDQNVDELQIITQVRYFHGKKIVGDLI